VLGASLHWFDIYFYVASTKIHPSGGGISSLYQEPSHACIGGYYWVYICKYTQYTWVYGYLDIDFYVASTKIHPSGGGISSLYQEPSHACIGGY
jgi:hypothetical protein